MFQLSFESKFKHFSRCLLFMKIWSCSHLVVMVIMRLNIYRLTTDGYSFVFLNKKWIIIIIIIEREKRKMWYLWALNSLNQTLSTIISQITIPLPEEIYNYQLNELMYIGYKGRRIWSFVLYPPNYTDAQFNYNHQVPVYIHLLFRWYWQFT